MIVLTKYWREEVLKSDSLGSVFVLFCFLKTFQNVFYENLVASEQCGLGDIEGLRFLTGRLSANLSCVQWQIIST